MWKRSAGGMAMSGCVSSMVLANSGMVRLRNPVEVKMLRWWAPLPTGVVTAGKRLGPRTRARSDGKEVKLWRFRGVAGFSLRIGGSFFSRTIFQVSIVSQKNLNFHTIFNGQVGRIE